MLVTLCSTDIIWENEAANLKVLDALFSQFAFKPDIIILPEMFSTGFTMDSSLARSMDESDSLIWMKRKASQMQCAIVGSLPVVDGIDQLSGKEKIVNRLFFLFPDGSFHYYDKRHLFRMGEENSHYTAGKEKCIVEYGGVRFALNVCYDLRFPVWSRNVGNEYDVLLNVANFPQPRVSVIEPLCRARAIENISYMLFTNRTGEDPQCRYVPSSFAFDFKGNNIGREEYISGIQIINADIDIGSLRSFREKFPAWMDADGFNLI